MGCLQVPWKFLMKRAFNSAHVLIELGGRPFKHVRAGPSNIMMKYLAQTASLTSNISIANS
jgi:hypothetical protein